MNIFTILNSLFYFAVGLAVLIYILKRWNDKNKLLHRYSEVALSIMYFVMGLYVLIYLEFEDLTPTAEYNMQLILFFSNIATHIFLYPMNYFREMIRLKKHPELVHADPTITREYNKFLTLMEEKHKDSMIGKNYEFKKDLSRKLLHIIQFSVIVILTEFSYSIKSTLISMDLTPLAFRNTIFFILAGFFLFMFTENDLFRMVKFEYCPNWARKWLLTSLEPRESWTFISSIPFLLTMLLFIFAPNSVLFSTAIVSCIADSAASIVGKSMGHRKWGDFKKKIGKFPNKTVEGTIAGAFSAFLGVNIIFHFYPISNSMIIIGLSSSMIGMISSILAVIAFVFVDLYGDFLADNILNSFIPGVLIWGFLFIIGA